ncbi:hypothetical protein VTJ04DRAFT_8811 [Mycothermus thermophilus]|uniref:uncharacterized protein n=1 Tax=Humicola insolens TaxID=85995 RepID=UPI003744204B
MDQEPGLPAPEVPGVGPKTKPVSSANESVLAPRPRTQPASETQSSTPAQVTRSTSQPQLKENEKPSAASGTSKPTQDPVKAKSAPSTKTATLPSGGSSSATKSTPGRVKLILKKPSKPCDSTLVTTQVPASQIAASISASKPTSKSSTSAPKAPAKSTAENEPSMFVLQPSSTYAKRLAESRTVPAPEKAPPSEAPSAPKTTRTRSKPFWADPVAAESLVALPVRDKTPTPTTDKDRPSEKKSGSSRVEVIEIARNPPKISDKALSSQTSDGAQQSQKTPKKSATNRAQHTVPVVQPLPSSSARTTTRASSKRARSLSRSPSPSPPPAGSKATSGRAKLPAKRARVELPPRRRPGMKQLSSRSCPDY